LLELVDESGAVAAAQTITPQGEKRLLTGSAKRGAYHAVNAPESPQSVLIAEGLATALSVHLMRPDALTVAAMTRNLLPVAEVMRRKHPRRKLSSPQTTTTTKTEKPIQAGGRRESRLIRGWLGITATDRLQSRLERLPPAKRAGSRYSRI
jgi:putative DNA primase/helicase